VFVVRPIKKSDLDEFYKLAGLAKAGITTLPHDKKLLGANIKDSLKSFSKKTDCPGDEKYLFVMEDTKRKRLVGTCAVKAKVGGKLPSYTYKIKTVTKKSKLLGVNKEIQFLKLKKDYIGPSTIGTLFLNPSSRQKGCGRLLVLSRFLFIAQYQKRFRSSVIAELRGVLDKKDHSPFWNAVCKHFFVVNFKKADLMVMHDKSFIEELIPKHPIYVPILPKKVQAIIGQVHPNTVPAMKLLEQEGFDFIDEIDIFEAGPVLGAKTKSIRTVKKSQKVILKGIVDRIDQGDDYLIANVSSFKNFRVTMDQIVLSKKSVVISKEAARALQVKKGEHLRVVKARG